MKIVLLCRSLNVGGAERQIVILANGLLSKGHEVSVAIFYSGGPLEQELHHSRIPILDLRKSGRWDVVPFFIRLVRAVGQLGPDIVYGFLGMPNILTITLKPFFQNIKMVWGVRASNMDLDRYDWLSRASYRLECLLSRFADQIICNSNAGYDYAIAQGFHRGKMRVVPNGIDTDRFKPDKAIREKIRKEWIIGDDEVLIGLVARLDPMKDHATFLRAAAILVREKPNLRFVCVGDGPEPYTVALHQLANDLGLGTRLFWTGSCRNMPAVFNALDIVASSSSFGEGFSNAIAEAMACGIPCVVTDVGDSAFIAAEIGSVVSISSPKDMADGLLAILERLGPQLSDSARTSIVVRFSKDRLIENTLDALSCMN